METKSIDTLVGAPYNPRILDKHDGESLDRSMKRWGDISGVTKNVRTGIQVTGHQRIEILKKSFGPERVKIQITERLESPDEFGTVASGFIIVDGTNLKLNYREVDWDEGNERAANIAANRVQGRFNMDLLAEVTYELSQLENGADLLQATGQLEDEVNRLLDMVGASGDTNPADDEAPEVDNENPPVSKLGEIYQLGRHKLMCGDSTDFGAVSDLMDGEEADMIFTDPPYNVDYEGKTKEALTIQNDSMSDAEFYEFLFQVHKNMADVSKPGASIYVCHADLEGLNFRKALIDSGFLLKQCIIWVKQSMVMGRQDYQWQHEPILYGWKDGASHYFVDDRTQTTVWNIDRPSRNDEHPTMKPIELVEKALLNSSKRGHIVIDFFSGSGSTLIACEKTERNCYGMELDPKYCDVIRKRYAKHTGQDNWIEATPIIQESPNEQPPTPQT